MIRVCVAGATGWAGSPVATAILEADDLSLVCGVSRKAAGTDRGTALGRDVLAVPVAGSIDEAVELGGIDVVVDYTAHAAVKANVTAAIARGMSVVVGSSRLSAGDTDTR